MGFFSKLLSVFDTKKKVKIIVVGLANSGKTTIINWIKPKKKGSVITETTPTIGYSVENFNKKNFNFTIFDMSGQDVYRDLWEKYYQDVQGIIFVLDSAQKTSFVVAKNELEMLLTHNDIKGRNIPVLFLANKMDIPGSAATKECVTALGLENITDRSWQINNTDAIQGLGIEEGLKWLMERLSVKK